MITNEDRIKKDRAAFENAEGAYLALRRDLQKRNERLFKCFVQSYLDLLLDIRDSIDAQLGLKRSETSQPRNCLAPLNDDLVAELRKTQTNLEATLDTLRLTIRPQSEEWYRAVSQPCIEMILDIRDQLDAYFGIHRPVYDDDPSEVSLATTAASTPPEPVGVG
jgi:molecular chaperone GrpE (heat shock protein)